MKTAAIIDKCENVFGRLRAPERARLKAVLRNPTQETWDNAYSLIISGRIPRVHTLWQAWIHIDPSAPRSKPLEGPWPKIPDEITLRRAILAVT